MPAGRAELVGHVAAENVGLHRRVVGLQRAPDQTCVGLRVLAERDDTFHAGAARPMLQAGEQRIVAVDHRHAAALEAEEDLGLGVGDGLERAEELEMDRLDGGDDRHLRPCETGERRDLAGVVHAHLEHRIARMLRTARERQRHPPMIVVGRDRGMGLAVLGQRQPQRLLGSGLADRAGDADDACAWCARALRAASSRRPSSTSGTTSSGASCGSSRACRRRPPQARRRTAAPRTRSRGRRGCRP